MVDIVGLVHKPKRLQILGQSKNEAVAIHAGLNYDHLQIGTYKISSLTSHL